MSNVDQVTRNQIGSPSPSVQRACNPPTHSRSRDPSQLQVNNDKSIKEILLSLPSVKRVRVKISARFFGLEWAATAPKEKYDGTITNWKNKSEELLLIHWEGYHRAKAHTLDDLLGEDEDGDAYQTTRSSAGGWRGGDTVPGRDEL